MIKKLTLMAAVLLIGFSVNAQIKVTVGGGLVLPMGDLGDVAKTGFGGNAGAKYMISDNMAIGASLGYFMFGEKFTGVKLSTIPVVGSFTYYFATEGFKTYAGADFGFYVWKVDIDGFGSDSQTNKGFAPTVGFEYSISDKIALDVNAKYHIVLYSGGSDKYVGVNFGLVYSL